MSFEIPKVFQKNILLLEILFKIYDLVFVRIIEGIQSFALENFRISLDSFKSFFSDNMMYINTNLAISPKIGIYWNLFVLWINVLINNAALYSDIPEGI